jgi:integrase
MGSLRRKTATRALPEGAERFERKGQPFVRWVDKRGKKQTSKLTIGKDGAMRVVVPSGKWLAKYRDADGLLQEVSTGCSDKDAARAVLKELERRAELIKAKVISPDEAAVADCQNLRISEQLEAYIRSLKAAGRSRRHITDTERLVRRIATECGFRTLGDMHPEKVEGWLADQLDAGMAARTRNSYVQALSGFCTWCVRNRKLTANPLHNIQKADEKSDRRRQRRALTKEEINRLLTVAFLRPLAEVGRETQKKPANKVTGTRDTWNPAPLTYDTIEAAAERARERLRNKPERIAELERTGHERCLVYKVMLTTGLRLKELQSLKIGQAHLNSPSPFLELAAADEKNREGTSIPLRQDIATELREWFRRRDQELSPAVSEGDDIPSDVPLLYVPSGLRRILDRDLKVAGIPKRDDRGRTIDVHAMRHTFGTMLSQNGVAPRTAQAAMRHSKIDLTMNVYTDPRLLDVSGAMEALPAMSAVTYRPRTSDRAKVRDTGIVGGNSARNVPPLFPPNPGHQGESESIPVTLERLGRPTSGASCEAESEHRSAENPTKKASLPVCGNEAFERPRRDLNPQPPDRQSGALTN